MEEYIYFTHLEKFNIYPYSVYGMPNDIKNDIFDFFYISGYKSLLHHNYIRFNFLLSVFYADNKIYSSLIQLTKEDFNKYITFFKHKFYIVRAGKKVHLWVGIKKGEIYNEKKVYSEMIRWVEDKILKFQNKKYLYKKRITKLNKQLKSLQEITKRWTKEKKTERFKLLQTIKAYKFHIKRIKEQIDIFINLKLDRYQYHLIKRLMYDIYHIYKIGLTQARSLLSIITLNPELSKKKFVKRHIYLMQKLFSENMAIYLFNLVVIDFENKCYEIKPEKMMFYHDSGLNPVILIDRIFSFLEQVRERKKAKFLYVNFVKMLDVSEYRVISYMKGEKER